MGKPNRLYLLVVTLVLTLGVIASQSANAYTGMRHHNRVHRHVRHYHMTVNPIRSYGEYPNIRYFQQDGHIYAKNLDSGDSYLVRW